MCRWCANVGHGRHPIIAALLYRMVRARPAGASFALIAHYYAKSGDGRRCAGYEAVERIDRVVATAVMTRYTLEMLVRCRTFITVLLATVTLHAVAGDAIRPW